MYIMYYVITTFLKEKKVLSCSIEGLFSVLKIYYFKCETNSG